MISAKWLSFKKKDLAVQVILCTKSRVWYSSWYKKQKWWWNTSQDTICRKI